MGIEIRLPNITGSTEWEQLVQVRSYLYQLSEQLQYAFDNLNTIGGTGNNGYVVNQPRGYTASSVATGGSGGGISFAELKALIIKSADIVDAYYEEISKKLEGQYVAQSDFGTYVELTSQEITANSTAITQTYENTQLLIQNTKSGLEGYTDSAVTVLNSKVEDTNGRIDETIGKVSNLDDAIDAANSRLDEAEGDLTEAKEQLNTSIQTVSDSVSRVDGLLKSAKEELKGSIDDLQILVTGLSQVVVDVSAYIKSGLLYYTDASIPVYGMEIGQTVEANGEEVFNKFARFTSEKLSFYDANENEVAYISDKKLYIRQAEITTSLKIGKLIDLVMSNGDVVTKWEGGS